MAQVMVPHDEDRILTAANAFTTIRLLCVPLFVVLLARPHHRGWFPAAVLLAALGATDWVDGQLARRLHQVTRLGRVLDPTADRILLATATIGIVVVGAVPLPVAVIALVRESVVAGGAIGLTMAGAGRIEVQLAGKAGTFGLMCALPLFLAGHSNVSWHHSATVLAWVSAVGGLTLGWVAVVTYIPLARSALRQRQVRGQDRDPRTEEARR
jgi:cardiolipin synthase